MAYKAQLRVWRGDAGQGSLADYSVEVNEGEVVPDVLHRLQATQARRPRGPVELQGRQVRILLDGDQRPAQAGLHDADEHVHRDETITLTPLRTFPVIRDLVTDVSFNYAKAREIPSFTPDPSVGPGRVPDAAGRRGDAPGRCAQNTSRSPTTP